MPSADMLEMLAGIQQDVRWFSMRTPRSKPHRHARGA
jgi:hypothetical protein